MNAAAAIDAPELALPASPGRKAKRDQFVGSKGGSGIAQWLISLMPVHTHYVEAFLGKGVVLRTKLRASVNIGIEEDAETLRRYWFGRDDVDWLQLVCGDALEFLPKLHLPPTALVYADPPYPGSVRIDTHRRYYALDKLDDAWHERFLEAMLALRCMVIVSGFENELYSTKLAGWRTSWKWTIDRGGNRVREFVWLNFAPPALLHDARFVGGNFTARQRVKRKIERWRKKFKAMPAEERFAMFDALSQCMDEELPALLVKDEPTQGEML